MRLFVFQFYPAYNFGKSTSFGLGTVRSERDKLFRYWCLEFFFYAGDSICLVHGTFSQLGGVSGSDGKMSL